ncbi:NADH pyrophosphatase [Paraconexibacter sp. AEG42_29]|uniref:NAD(+) diphosphatase n=1 Tax=Paraconexibacter sp. AEG42_29 TaxID=2997339 RepID=A0AAU7AXQ8_9ACTN
MSDFKIEIPFGGAVHDRAGLQRIDAEWIEAARVDPASRVVVLAREGALVHGDVAGMGPDDWYGAQGSALTAARLAVADGIPDDAVLLGLDDRGKGVFAVDRLPDTAVRPDDVAPLDLRAAAALLPAADAGLLAQANALLHWHRMTRFCGVCGQPTESREAGHMRACPDDHQQHPRTDPVVIMLVVDPDPAADRVLMGRQPSWPPSRYSALAGFVEPGEALEAAVAREIMEEAQVRVSAVRYVASQPWPFPASLMLGFEADWAGGEAAIGDDELEDVRWFSRAELLDAVEAEKTQRTDVPLLLPPKLAIARHLVDHWLHRER